MIGLFFEVMPREGHVDRYFELAAALRPELDRSGGLLFIDRYQSLDRPGVILSHQHWADEASLIRWREHGGHLAVQRAGREKHFEDYRIRIGREAAEPTGAVVTATYLSGAEPAGGNGERFKSVYREGAYLLLADGAAAGAARADAEVRSFAIFRDYGMHERAQAPRP